MNRCLYSLYAGLLLCGSVVATPEAAVNLSMPLVRLPDQTRVDVCHTALRQQLQINARNRAIVRGVSALSAAYIVYTLLGSAKQCVGRMCGYAAAQQPLSHEQLTELVRSVVDKSLWARFLEIAGCSSLGFFVTQVLERVSAGLAKSLFYPLTARWFIERTHPIVLMRSVSLDADVSGDGERDLTAVHSPYVEEIEGFIGACSQETALLVDAHDAPSYCVLTAINSFVGQAEWVLAFMQYQEQQVSPVLAGEIAVTRQALMHAVEEFALIVRTVVQKKSVPLVERKQELLGALHAFKSALHRLIVHRLYRLETEA